MKYNMKKPISRNRAIIILLTPLVMYIPLVFPLALYDIQQEIFELYRISHGKIFYSNLAIVNRTVKVFNASFILYETIPDNAMLSVKGYKWLGQQYRLTPIQPDWPAKNMYKTNLLDVNKIFSEYAQPKLEWPFKANVTYKIYGWKPSPKNGPPNLPPGKYKMNVLIRDLKEIYLGANWFIEVKEIIRW